jgi:hypothetical protein
MTAYNNKDKNATQDVQGGVKKRRNMILLI